MDPRLPQGVSLSFALTFSGRVVSFAWSELGDRLAVLLDDGQLEVFDAHGASTEQIPTSLTGVSELVWWGQNIMVAAGSRVVAVDVQTREVRNVVEHPASVRAIASHANANFLASASIDGTVLVTDGEKKETFYSLRTTSPPTALAWSLNGETLFIGCEDGTIHRWVPEHEWIAPVLKARDSPIRGLLYLFDSVHLLISCTGTGLTVWNAETGKLSRRFAPTPVRGYDLLSFALSPDEREVAAISNGGTIRMWDWQTRSQTQSFGLGTSGKSALCRIAFHPMRRLLAAGTRQATSCACWKSSRRLLPSQRPSQSSIRQQRANPSFGPPTTSCSGARIENSTRQNPCSSNASTPSVGEVGNMASTSSASSSTGASWLRALRTSRATKRT